MCFYFFQQLFFFVNTIGTDLGSQSSWKINWKWNLFHIKLGPIYFEAIACNCGNANRIWRICEDKVPKKKTIKG